MKVQLPKINRAEAIFILAGTSSQYTAARQKLDLSPGQAFWLTRPADLADRHGPKVYRFGTWQALPRLEEIQAAMKAAEAEVIDLSG